MWSKISVKSQSDKGTTFKINPPTKKNPQVGELT
jgi:hypothetical protein